MMHYGQGQYGKAALAGKKALDAGIRTGAADMGCSQRNTALAGDRQIDRRRTGHMSLHKGKIMMFGKKDLRGLSV